MTSSTDPNHRLPIIACSALALLLAACSPHAQQPHSSSATPAKGTTTATQPATKLDTSQARTLVTLGQRDVDGLLGVPATPGSPQVEGCDGERPYPSAPERSWVTDTAVPDAVVNGRDLRDKVRLVAATSNSATVLDDSPSAVAAMDTRLGAWPSCTGQGRQHRAVKVSAPGAAVAVAYSSVDPAAHKSARHTVMAAARIHNLVVTCRASGPQPSAPTATAISCLQDMVAGASVVQKPAATDGVLATRALLAGLASPSWATKSIVRTSTPCPGSTGSFLPRSAVAVEVITGTASQEQVVPFSTVMVQRLATPAAARAQLATGRRLLNQCARKFVLFPDTYPMPGAVDKVAAVAVGDGGVGIASHSTYRDGPVDRSYELLLSTGPYVAHVVGQGPEPQAEALQTAKALVERIKSSG